MIGSNLLKKIKESQDRLDQLPEYIDDVMSFYAKQDGKDFIELFQENIKEDKLNLEPLAGISIAKKESFGYSQPETPLYGAGDEEENSYYNMFELKKIKNGWQAIPRKEKHHKSALMLDHLLQIHENGATINTGNGGMIRIPPRPAAFLTFEEYKTKKKKKGKTRAGVIRKALTWFMNTGKDKLLKNITFSEKDFK